MRVAINCVVTVEAKLNSEKYIRENPGVSLSALVSQYLLELPTRDIIKEVSKDVKD